MTDRYVDTALRETVALIEMRRYGDAAARAQEVLAADPDSAPAACLLALSAIRSGDPDLGLGAAEFAISVEPDWEWPHRLASGACAQLGDEQRAVAEAEEAVRLAPSDHGTHLCLAEVLLQFRRIAEAHARSDLALKLAPDSADAHFLIGRVARAEERDRDAERAYQRAIELDPGHAPAHKGLAGLTFQASWFGGATLANAANGFASALHAAPDSEPYRRNIELAVTTFLRRMAGLLFIAVWIEYVSSVSRLSGHAVGRPLTNLGLPLMILFVLPAAFVARFISRLTPRPRRVLLDMVSHRPELRVPLALEFIALGCLLGEAVTSGRLHNALGSLSVMAVIAASVILTVSHRKGVKRRRTATE
jgi:tetratricopeptide (TPR) repeat protein